MTTGTLVYLLFAYTPALDEIGDFFFPIFEEIFPYFMFAILFVTFCKIDFHKLRLTSWHLWVALLQLVFVAIIVGSILAFRIGGDSLILLEALLVCIISPAAAAAPVVAAKLGADIEQVTSYVFLSNIITAVMVPLCFPLIDQSVDMPFLHAFLRILYKVCLVLLVPMAGAWLVKHKMHRLHRRIVSINDLGFYCWGVSLTIVTGITVRTICHAETGLSLMLLMALLGLVLCIVQFAVGRYIGHFFHHSEECGQSLGQKNTAFAIWIAYVYLSPVASIGPGCYILWQNAINSIEIYNHEHRKKQLRHPASDTQHVT